MKLPMAEGSAIAFLLMSCWTMFPAAVAAPRAMVIEESATLPAPDPAWTYVSRYVAIDGDWALAQGDRYIPDPDAETGRRHDGAALLYHKVNGQWTYAGILGVIDVVDEWTKPGIAMRNGVAMIIEKSVRVFERNGTTWSESPLDIPATSSLQGSDIVIDSGRILVPQNTCSWTSDIYSKVNGAWTREGTLPGHANECGDNPSSPQQDLEGTRAVVFNSIGPNDETPVARLYRPAAAGGWQQFATLAPPSFISDFDFGSQVALHGPYVAVGATVETGTLLFREQNQSWALSGVLQPVDAYMQWTSVSAPTLDHGGNYFFQRNYSFDRQAYVVNVFEAVGDAVTHVATLAARNGGSLGWSIDVSGNQVIVGGRDGFLGDNTVRVFELPAPQNIALRALRLDDFEQPGAGSDWQPSAGSAFSVVQSGNTRVYRQTNVAAKATSIYPAFDSANQSVQAEITPRSFSGNDRWFGLTTRYTDDANHYYLTARSSGVIDLKRMVNGVYTTLDSVNAPIQAGQKYRLRLESIGTMHRAYFNDLVLFTVYDAALPGGDVGVMMYRTSADYDNVMISPSAFTTINKQDFYEEEWLRWKNTGPGAWTRTENGIYRQTSTAGGTRSVTGTPTDDVIVQTRLRATSFDGADRWVGLLAGYVDDNNHVYVTMRSSNVLSLRYLVNGTIHDVASAPMPVTPNQWYTLRMERAGGKIRVYVDDVLRISAANVGPIKGQVGLGMYKATAEFEDFLSYQP